MLATLAACERSPGEPAPAPTARAGAVDTHAATPTSHAPDASAAPGVRPTSHDTRGPTPIAVDHEGLPAPPHAPLAASPLLTAGPPRVRAAGRWFVHDLVANSDRVGWLEHATRAEADRPISEAPSRWMTMPLAGGAPRVAASGLRAGSTDLDVDDQNVYLWLGAPSESVFAMPFGGGAPRPLAPLRYGARVAARDGAVCFLSVALRNDGLFCVPREGGRAVEVAHVPGGDRAPVLLGGMAYWHRSGQRCVVRAPVTGGGAFEVVSCSGAFVGPMATDGDALYVLGGHVEADGDHSAVYVFRPARGEWTLLRELPDAAQDIAARDGRVAVLTSSSRGSTVTVIDAQGRACVMASAQANARHVALGAGHVLWTTGRATLGLSDIVAQDFATNDTDGPCAAPRALP